MVIQPERITKGPRPKKLLEQVRDAIQRKHYSPRTEESYIHWIKRYVVFHDKRHPQEMGSAQIEAFLTHLAVRESVAASTQNQALAAILFLYREVLQKELDRSLNAVRAKRPKRLPTVLTKEEVFSVIQCMVGVHQLMVKLLYGSGLRLSECVQLSVKDIDFAQGQIIVRDAKGMQDRVTVLPESPDQSASGPSPAGETAARGRREERLWFRLSSVCSGSQVPQCQPGVELAICFSLCSLVPRSQWRRAPFLRERDHIAKSRETGRTVSRDQQARQLPHLPTQFCHTSAPKWL